MAVRTEQITLADFAAETLQRGRRGIWRTRSPRSIRPPPQRAPPCAACDAASAIDMSSHCVAAFVAAAGRRDWWGETATSMCCACRMENSSDKSDVDRASASAHRSVPSLRMTLHRIRRPLSSSDDRLSFAAFAAADVADVRDSAFGREAHPLPVHDRVHRELRPATDADLHDGTIVLTRFLVNRVRLNQLRGEDSNLQPSP